MQGRMEHKLEAETQVKNKIVDYPDFMQKYYNSLRTKSHTTKTVYINQVVRFLNYISEQFNVEINDNMLKSIDKDLIDQYISDISFKQKKGKIVQISSDAIAQTCSSLNNFLTYCKGRGLVERNPFKEDIIERPKVEDKDITYLTPNEIEKVEYTILHGNGTLLAKAKQEDYKYRDFLLFRIPIITGIRVTALDEINVEDIDFSNKTIKVTEKGNVTKDIYFDDKTDEYLRLWLRKREYLLDGIECGALFISNQKKRMTTRSIGRIVQKYTEGIVDKHITPHKLRSTCGTNLYQQTKDIYLTSAVLGHKNVAVTRKYAAIFNEDRKNAATIIANLYDKK